MTAGTAQSELNTILLDWGNKVGEWETWCLVLAKVKGARDNRIVALKTKSKAADPKIAETWAKTLAEADDEVQRLNLDELIAEANIDAIRKRLDWFEMRAKAKQSEVSTEREEAKVWQSAPSVPR